MVSVKRVESDKGDVWVCDQGQGEVSVPLTVASPGQLRWIHDDDMVAEFTVGQEVILECAAVDSVPEGQ